MKRLPTYKKMIFRVVLALAAISFLVGSSATGAALADSQAQYKPEDQQDTTTINLPIIVNRVPRPATTFGVEVINLNDGSILDKATTGGVYWVRTGPIDWSLIEPVRTNPPTYKWDVVNENTFINAANRGLEVMVKIQFTPAWAQKVPGSSCGPVHPDNLDEYAQFVRAVVARYSAHPYSVRYWEIGNEPDIDPSQIGSNSIFGCWGDVTDPYFGGGYYAEMLKVVYPAIKAADPKAQVVLGGLLLDCDPTHPNNLNKTCTSTNFLEGILRNGGGAFFDYVNFHGYPQFYGNLQNDEKFEGWDERGGVVLGKISFIKEIMAKYGINKPIIHSEGALTCPETNTRDCTQVTNVFLEAQADYVVWLYVRNIAAGVSGTIWYYFDWYGWRESGMLGNPADPKPAYKAFQFLTQELDNATYVNMTTPYSQYPNLRVYQFNRSGKNIWVMWSADEVAHTVAVPAGATKIVDKYGVTVDTSSGVITIKSPIYVEY